MSEYDDGEQEWFITGIQLIDRDSKPIIDINMIDNMGDWKEEKVDEDSRIAGFYGRKDADDFYIRGFGFISGK